MNTLKELILSYRKGDLSQLKSLIIKGVDIHARDDYALRLAALRGHLEVVKYLVKDCDADVHARDDKALRLAAGGGHLDVVKYLKQRQIDKQNVVYVSKQYNLPIGIQQLIFSYV